MRRPRYAVLPLLLGSLVASACQYDITGDGGIYDGGVKIPLPTISTLIFHGLVTSAAGGELLPGVTVRIDAPARGWSETVVTGPSGDFWTDGLLHPAAADCVGLSATFSRDGYQALRVVDFPLLTCGPGYADVSVSLTAAP
jgi:hypothetical protein